MKKILYIQPSFCIYGGTPKKTLDLMECFGESTVLYVYESAFTEFKKLFEETGGKVYEGFHGWNIYRHICHLIEIIDENEIAIIQTQFTMGEILGYLIKLFKPKIKLLIAFVGALPPPLFKKLLVSQIYNKADEFVFISNYVKSERINQFPHLIKKKGEVIFNGTGERTDDGSEVVKMQSFSLLAISGLTDLKNIQVLIKSLNTLVNSLGKEEVFLYVAGEGPQRNDLERLVNKYELRTHVFLLGYQRNVGRLLNLCDAFVHPAYSEGFGIAVAEAMMAEKPIIVANAGALPELIEHKKSGMIVDPYDPEEWTKAIVYLIDNPKIAAKFALNAKKRAYELFSLDMFCGKYRKIYNNLFVTGK